MTVSSRFITYVFFLGMVQDKFVLVHGDCWYDNKKHDEHSEVPTGEPCLNCTCSRSVLLCYLRVCPKLPNPPPPGCILLHRYRTCCPELICSDFHDGGNSLEARADPEGDLDIPSDDQSAYENACISNGSIYGPGSAMHSSSLCEYCYCLAGKQVCVKPKCLLPIEGCRPVFEENSCCPVRYNCIRDQLPESVTEQSTTTFASINSEVKQQDGCFVEGTHYLEGSKVVGIGHSVCDNCYCLRGLLRCEPLSCAPPLLGCAPVVKPGECCAASYNCNGTLEIEPEPNYGLFPTISKEYSKLRKEVQRKPSSKQTHKNKEDVVTVAPFYVLAETLQEPTTKLLYQRSPDTYGTTRHFSGASFKSSSTQKPPSTITENHFFLISSSKQRSSTTTGKPSVVPGVYYGTTNYEFQNTNYKRVYSTTLRSNIRSMPTGRLRLSSLMPPEAKDESSNDYLGLGNLNILSIVDSLMEDGNLYRQVDSDDKKTSLITESSTTMGTTDSTEWTTNNIVDSTTNTSPIDEEFTEESTLPTTTTDMDGGPVTVTTVVKSTDCINGVEQNLPKGSEDIDVSTLLPSDPADVNNLAEGRTEFISTTEDFSSSESSSTEEINVTDVKSRNISNSKLPPDIEAILNISKHKNGEDFDYDYNEPSLPPSLPNLKIIPFVAADALDAKKESPKDPTPVFIDKKVDVGPLEYTSNMFKPPVETEGGFMPKEPSIIDTFYSNSVPSITSESNDQNNNVVSCISGGKELLHGMPVDSETPCMTCTCFYGNVVCQKTDCPPPKPGCKVAVEQGVNLCCPNYVCDKPIIEPLNIPPKIPQEIVTVAEGIVHLDPFKDVIRTEPAPNLQSLIGDMISYQKITSSTPMPSSSEDSIPITSPHPKLETTTEDANENFSFDKVLQFIFSGTPDIIEKPLSQNPSIPKSEATSTKTENLLPKNSSYNNLTVKVPSYTPSTQKTLLEGSSTTNSYVKIDLIKNSNNNNKTKQNSVGEKLKTKIQNKIKTVEQTNKHSIGVGLLKLAGCNIYGRMYRVGRIISELSGPCLECKCTEVGVQCRQLRCLNGASINNG